MNILNKTHPTIRTGIPPGLWTVLAALLVTQICLLSLFVFQNASQIGSNVIQQDETLCLQGNRPNSKFFGGLRDDCLKQPSRFTQKV